MKKLLKMKQWLLLLIVIGSIGGIFFTMFDKRIIAFAEKLTLPSQAIEIQTPTIMVPGTGGTVNRFNGLIKTLSKELDTSVLKVTVAKDGSVTSRGSLKKNAANPIIVIGFEDSSDDTLAEQGQWYQNALTYIQKYYTFSTYNYLGHSNGGLVITSYLENFKQATDPKLSKLITLGTPYNDVSTKYNDLVTDFSEVKATSSLLAGYLEDKTAIPASIEMINIAGDVQNKATDQTVPVQSVFSGRLIYQDQVASYTEKLIQSGDASHSALVENPEVIQQIKAFFWNK